MAKYSVDSKTMMKELHGYYVSDSKLLQKICNALAMKADTIDDTTVRNMDKIVKNLRERKVSKPIDLSDF